LRIRAGENRDAVRVTPMRSLVPLSLAMLSVAALVSPWGNYPVNDDWQYARILRHLFETGRFRVDVDVAPSLVGQIWLSLPIVKLAGFSHTALRAETFVVAVALLWIVDRILQLAGVASMVRGLAAILLIVNPVFLHVALSYMTEPYGYAVALTGALVWLGDRAGRRGDDDRLVGWRAGLTAATLVGLSFWIRQFCAAVFPALVAATAFRAWVGNQRVALRRTVPVFVVSAAWLFVLMLGYFVWAKLSGNYRPAFGGQIRSLVHVSVPLVVISAFELAAYLTLFLFPFLLLEEWRSTRWNTFVALAVGAVVWIVAARMLQRGHVGMHHHIRFPFAMNVVNDTAVGPLTLTTTYWDQSGARPQWPPGAWIVVEGLLLVGTLLWARLGSAGRTEPSLSRIAAEVRDFGVCFAVLSFGLYMQAFQWTVLDRYFLPCVLGSAVALGARTTRCNGGSTLRARRYAAIAAAAPLAWFTIAGVHDYFRWNDARWTAVLLAIRSGARPETLDAGYEVNGWLNYDDVIEDVKPTTCLGRCGCLPRAFYCTDDSYMVSFGLPPGREQIADLPVAWWLAHGPNIVVSRRR
jgi:hypothetical protein